MYAMLMMMLSCMYVCDADDDAVLYVCDVDDDAVLYVCMRC